ncbi:MAG: hypothetical protein WC102_03195 [Saccharofermentanales bacterium]
MTTNEVPWNYDLVVEKLASDKEGNLYIAGYASNGDVDEDGEVMDLESLKMVYQEYMKNPVIKLMHDKVPQWKGAIGTVVPEYTDIEGNIFKTEFSTKPFLVIKLAKGLPEWIYSAVKDGVYKGLSIGGKLAKKVGNRLYVKSWLETSLVDIPSARGSFVNVLKCAGESAEEEEPDREFFSSQEDISKALDKVQELVHLQRLSNASCEVETFLKGGPGSGIKGHRTYHSPEELKAKYKKDSQELNAKYNEVKSHLDEAEKKGESKVKEGQDLIDQSSKETDKKLAGEKSQAGLKLRSEGYGLISEARTKKKGLLDKYTKLQTELSQKLMEDLSSDGKLNIKQEPTKAHEPPKEQATAKKEPSEPSVDKEEAKKQARRERAKKRREAKKAGEQTGTTPVGEGSGTSKEEEKKAKRKERAAKRREAKKNQSKESEPKKLSGGVHPLKQGYTLSSKGEHLTPSDVKWTKKRLVKNGYEVRVIKTGDNSYDFYVKKDYRKELLAHKEEHVVVVDESGKELGRNKGDEDSTDYPSLKEIHDSTRKLMAHHNHPEGGTLSGRDVLGVLSRPGMHGIYAHSPEGSYSISIPEGINRDEAYRTTKKTFEDNEMAAKDRIFEQYEGKIERSELKKKVDDARREAAKKSLRELHSKGLINYREELL